MIVRYKAVRQNIIRPTRANPSDAGLDVFFNPESEIVQSITINPGGSSLLQTGLKFEIPHGYMLQACNRSGIAAKKSLIVGAHIIDSGYNGEVFIDLHNIGSNPVEILRGDKVAQLVMVPVIHFRAVESEEIYDFPLTISNRGEGALGSTGR
jgi:dUTP pyrophosphatase